MPNEKDKESLESETKIENDTPLIKPGFDYIWGSDQDDLVEDKEE
jgi:hypothetical protein